jgi:hypothetical protein
LLAGSGNTCDQGILVTRVAGGGDNGFRCCSR